MIKRLDPGRKCINRRYWGDYPLVVHLSMLSPCTPVYGKGEGKSGDKVGIQNKCPTWKFPNGFYCYPYWDRIIIIRPGKVGSFFPISHFLDFEAGGWSLFIIDYAEVIQPTASHAWQNTKATHLEWLKTTRGILQIRRRVVHWEHNNKSWGGIVLVDAGGDGKQGSWSYVRNG